MTKFRFGLLAGFALGYYLGARAGEERYQQLNSALERAASALSKTRAAVDLGRERARSRRQVPPVYSYN